jgi:hypothetical protein
MTWKQELTDKCVNDPALFQTLLDNRHDKDALTQIVAAASIPLDAADIDELYVLLNAQSLSLNFDWNDAKEFLDTIHRDAPPANSVVWKVYKPWIP